jgi:hypothetical protein
MNSETIELINKISLMHGDSLLEKILDYCETFDKDPKEIGDFLQESEAFKDILYKDCIKNNIIKDSSVKINNDPLVW